MSIIYCKKRYKSFSHNHFGLLKKSIFPIFSLSKTTGKIIKTLDFNLYFSCSKQVFHIFHRIDVENLC